MKEDDDDDFFRKDPDDSGQPTNNPAFQALEKAIQEAYEKKVREYVIKYGELEEDEADTLFPSFKELETFALDLRKMRKNAWKAALVIEDDDVKDVDKDEDRVAITDNTKLKGSDKQLAEMRLTQSSARSERTKAVRGKKRESTFKDLAPEDRPSDDEYARMMDLLAESLEDNDDDNEPSK